MLISELNAAKELSSCHWNICTQVDVTADEIGSGTEDINVYWHPSRYDGLQEWLQLRKELGFQGAMLTTHYWEGFCLYPSPYGTRDVPHTNWGIANPSVNVTADFCNNARALGLKVGLYYNMEDLYYHTIGSPPVNFQTWCIVNITHLLTNYGTIDFLFIDAWGDWWAGNGGISYATVDYDTVLNVIRAAQPNCLVTINDHQNAGTPKGDFRLWERTGGEDTPEPPQGFTLFPALALHDTQHLEYGVGAGSGRWFAHRNRGLDPITHLSNGIARRFRCLYNGYIWFENDSPDDSGRPPRDTRAMVRELLYLPGTTLFQDTLVSSTFKALETYNTSWVNVGAIDAVRIGPLTGSYVDSVSVADVDYVYFGATKDGGRTEIECNFNSVDAGAVSVEATLGRAALGTSYDSAVLKKAADGSISLVVRTTSFGVTTDLTTVAIDQTKYPIIQTASKHRVVIERRGTLLTGELWTWLNGQYTLTLKEYGTSLNTGTGNAGFKASSSGSPTTGIHLTKFTFSNGRGIPTTAADDISNLMVRYKFDESLGTQATDTSGNLQHGTYTGSVSRSTGKVGTAALFAGGNIAVPAFLPVSDWSVLFWVFPTAFSAGAGLDAIYTTNGFPFQALHIHFTNSGVLDSYLNGSGGAQFGTAANWPLNTWTHIAVTSNVTTGVMSAYANGVSVGTPTAILPNFGCAFAASEIGNWSLDATRDLAGKLDDFRLYGRTLTQSDIAQAMAVGRPAGNSTILGIGLTM